MHIFKFPQSPQWCELTIPATLCWKEEWVDVCLGSKPEHFLWEFCLDDGCYLPSHCPQDKDVMCALTLRQVFRAFSLFKVGVYTISQLFSLGPSFIANSVKEFLILRVSQVWM